MKLKTPTYVHIVAVLTGLFVKKAEFVLLIEPTYCLIGI